MSGPPNRRSHPGEGWPQRWFDDQPDDIIRSHEIKRRDPWIEQQALYLNDEHRRLGANQIAHHLFYLFLVAYLQFRRTRYQADRFQSWSRLQNFAAWLIQIEGGKS
jgi:hypothetical protein